MTSDVDHTIEGPLLPDYGDACVTGLVPALLEGSHEPDWLSHDLLSARRVLLLVLDGLGWNQLQQRRGAAPVLTAMEGRSITTVAPSTTAAALTSISTGCPPGEHGVVGYRIAVDGAVLNALRWTTGDGDARRRIDPSTFQPCPAFGNQYPPVVTRAEFAGSGFSQAHLSATRLVGYADRRDLVDRTVDLLAAGDPFVYAYWDGIDRTAHEHGLEDRYEEELADCDAMVAALIDRVPPGTAVVVTADHGQVHVGDRILDLPPEVTSCLDGQSGEARFRWLHARPGAAAELHAAAVGAFGDLAWIRTRDEVEAECWLGPRLGAAARSRLGDVALVARAQVAFRDPAEVMSIRLIGRHGSLTPDEMLVPAVGVVTCPPGGRRGPRVCLRVSSRRRRVGAMEATSGPGGEDARMDQPEVLEVDDRGLQEDDPVDETIEHPAKVMRVGTMMKQLLEEVRAASLDEASRDRLKEIYETSVDELGSALSEDLRNELGRLALSFGEGEAPSSDELRIAQAQLVGWLEGLVQGIQATLFAQQMAAQQQLAGMRRGELGPGQAPPGVDARPGTYL